MDFLIGFVGKDYALIAADTNSVRSIYKYKDDEDKIMELDSYKLLGYGGERSDCTDLAEYIHKNMELYRFRNNLTLSTHTAANFIRTQMANQLRKKLWQANLLLAGYDEKEGPSLYYIDYLATMQKVNTGAHGYGSNFTLSLLDKYWKDDFSLEQGKDLMKKILNELKLRFLINYNTLEVKLVTKEGTTKLSGWNE